MKPESLPVAEEANWKTWKFKDIISGEMEAENLGFRKEIANFETKFNDQDRLHESVISELETERAHKATLQKTLEGTYTIIRSRDKEINNLKKATRGLLRQRDRLRNYLRQSRGSTAMDMQSGICLQVDFDHCSALSASAPSISIVKAIAFDGEEGTKHETSSMIMLFLSLTLIVEEALAEKLASDETADALAQVSVGLSREASCEDVFQVVRNRERYCNDISALNEYIKAYFANVHPLLPILHKEAFLRVYRLHGLKALNDTSRLIVDASTRDGRAVSLICSVLALGALSLVETRNPPEEENEKNTVSQLPHFGEALGFYGVCLRLLSYTHDTIETMITYLLMVVTI